MTVLPPSTSTDVTPRPSRWWSKAERSTSSWPARNTSARGNVRSHSMLVATRVGAEPSSTRAVSGVFPSESRTTRKGLRPVAYSAFTVSFGSSFRTVPMPTMIASTFALSPWTRRRSSLLLSRAPRPSGRAIFPSRLIAALMRTLGRTDSPRGGAHNNLWVTMRHLLVGRSPDRFGRTDEGPPRSNRSDEVRGARRRFPLDPPARSAERGAEGRAIADAGDPSRRDGVHGLRCRFDAREDEGARDGSRDRGGRGTREGSAPRVHNDPSALPRPRGRRAGGVRPARRRPVDGAVLLRRRDAAPRGGPMEDDLRNPAVGMSRSQDRISRRAALSKVPLMRRRGWTESRSTSSSGWTSAGPP